MLSMQGMKRCSRCEKSLPNDELHIEAVEGEGFGEVLHRVHAGNGHAPRVLFTGHVDYIKGHIDCSSRTKAERPSQVVHERTVASTPKGQDVVVAIENSLERCSTGGTRRE